MDVPPNSPTGKPPIWQPPTPEELQAQLPQYKVLAVLGRGGMGAVYKGWQISLDRPVAIKILPPDLDDDAVNFAERFKSEARTMARLSHPGIVPVYDAGQTTAGLLYFVMEFLEGTDVARMIRDQGQLESQHALAIAAHVCDALGYAHGEGIIHRDIKPANVMVNTRGIVKVADFGLAKVIKREGTGLTLASVVMGTPDFMAPEALVEGTVVDHRVDLYAVGVMLYQMLTGKLPRGAFQMPSQKVAGLDARYDMIVLKAMQTEPEERYASATDVRLDLDGILTQPVALEQPLEQENLPAEMSVGTRQLESVEVKFGRMKAATLQQVSSTPTGGKFPLLAVVLCLLIVAAAGGWFLVSSKKQNPDSEPAPSPVAESTPPAAPSPVVASPPETVPSPASSVAPSPPSSLPVSQHPPSPAPPAVATPVVAQPSLAAIPAPPAVVTPAVARPAPAALPADAVNLLSGVDVQRDSFFGTWRLEGGVLKSPLGEKDHHETIMLPVQDVPVNYDLRYRITRSIKGFAVKFYFLQGDGGGLVDFDTHVGSIDIAGIGSRVSIERGSDRRFKPGLTRDVLIQVRESSVAIVMDGEELLRADGRATKDGQTGYGQPRDAANPTALEKPLFIGISHSGGQLIVQEAQLLPVHPPSGPVTWTDTKGRTLTAQFKAISGDKLLVEIDGKPASVPLSNLSAESQKLARDLDQLSPSEKAHH